jgi:hypothetical protein
MVNLRQRKFPVKSISRNTALSCLSDLSSPGKMAGANNAAKCEDNELLSLDAFLALARSEFRVDSALLDWGKLIDAAHEHKILLILKNGNMISVIGTGRPEHEELVVSDPLYDDGATFFLPRTELEHAWDGEVLLLSSRTPLGWRLFHKFILLVSIAGILVGAYMLLSTLYTLVPARTGDSAQAGQHSRVQNPSRLETDYKGSMPTPTTEEDEIVEQVTPPIVNETAAPPAEDFVAARSVPPATEPERSHVEMNVIIGSSSELPNPSSLSLNSDAQTVGNSPPDVQSEPMHPHDSASTTATNLQLEERPKTAAVRVPTEKEPSAGISRADSQPDDAASTAATNLRFEEQPKTAAVRVLTEKELNAVISRADSMISRGDIHSGRLLYEYAAEAGNGPAALRLGETFDPAFLGLSGLRGVRGDPLKAAQWYERARQLGVTEAEILLRSIIGEEGRNR